MKVSRVTFEGSVEEFQAVADLFHAQPEVRQPGIGPIDPPPPPLVERKEIIRRMLRRKAIPNGQRQLYKALYPAGDDGRTQEEIVEIIGRTVPQLNGILGALGRRVNGTPGVVADANGSMPGIGLIMTVSVDRPWTYRLLPEFREVLDEEGLV
jgi:hypothetical protein